MFFLTINTLFEVIVQDSSLIFSLAGHLFICAVERQISVSEIAHLAKYKMV
jgi:hypothetical protein